jgi:hypothetical protein
MECASASRTSALLRPRNYQWYWNSAPDPWSAEEQEIWTKYTDVENEIIEDAYREKKNYVEIDGNYIIDLKQLIQQKVNSNKQRPINRIQFDPNQSSFSLREERFSSPVTIISSTFSTKSSDRNDNDWYNASFCNYAREIERKNTLIADVIEEAVQGILNEGTAINKTHEAQRLAEQLLEVKGFGTSVTARWTVPIPSEIGERCVYLYSFNSFLYRLLNQVLREPDQVTVEHLKTLGPFAYLLRRYLIDNRSKGNSKVYRGVNLTDEERQQFMKDEVKFTAFTSTSTNREAAEMFGNILLIFDLNFELGYGITMNAAVGADISHLSNFSHEKEYLIYPGTRFHFVRHEYNSEKGKHIIYLRSWFDK